MTLTTCWSEGYEAGKSGATFETTRCHDWKEGYCGGRIINERLGGRATTTTPTGRLQARVDVERIVDDLLVLPGEDASELIGERDALIEEKATKPGYNVEFDEAAFLDECLEDLRQRRTQPILRYTDEMLAEIEAERF